MKKIKNPYQGMEAQGYYCFACCPSNPYGLKMEFYEDGDDIVCFWKTRPEYQSWINTLHGGIQATLLDEIGGMVVNKKLQKAGMTTSLNMKYRRPVPVGDEVILELRAHIKEIKRTFAFIEATLSHNGEICSQCDMTYFCFSAEKSASDFGFHGCELEDE